MNLFAALYIVYLILGQSQGNELNVVGDEDLLQLIMSKNRLIVLFSKSNCPSCTEYKKQLIELKEDFEKEIGASVVSVDNSPIARLYSPSKEPALVFFRHGVPLLYDGEVEPNQIHQYFSNNQEPVVKELNDDIFEHLTQAATGATTGDWFIMFYGASCVECQRLQAVWEGVGASLKGRANVARIDAALAGLNTAKRFKVSSLPTFIFLRLGKQYKFDLTKHDIKTFVDFASGWYKNVKGERVPLLASPFDELVDWFVKMVQHIINFAFEILVKYPWVWQIGLAGFGLVIITSLIALFKAGTSTVKDSKKDKKLK